jgi:hypothetical protein
MSTRTFSLFVACIASWVGLAGAQPLDLTPVQKCNNRTKLCIGVRSAARPFSYKSILPGEKASDATRGPLRRAGYTGYMIRICDAALAEMILDARPLAELTFESIGVYDIDTEGPKSVPHVGAANATGNEAANTEADRFLKLGTRFDILCDPATITNERRDDVTVSPPLFLTGISYITRKGEDPPNKTCSVPEKPLIGVVGGTTASNEGIRALLEAHELPRFEEALIDYLRRGKKEPFCGTGSAERIESYDTHFKAAEAFCSGSFHYYVGDLEMITENVKMIAGCEYDNGTRTYTNDRYAVFGKARHLDDENDLSRRLLVARFFEILSQKVVFNPSILDKAFSDTFQGVSPSRKLELFYWSVRGEHE